MTASPPPASDAAGAPAAAQVSGRRPEPSPAAAPPVAARAAGGRARAFRRAETERRRGRRERYADVVLLAVAVVAAVLIVTTPPNSLLSGNGSSGSPGPPVRVNFGSVSVSAVPCAAGGTAYAERIPWTNASRSVTTTDIDLEVYAIFDGDNIGRGNPVANATPTNVCAGSPPDPTALWYVVLQAPNGTNVLTYTIADSWAGIAGGPSELAIANDSTLVLVSNSSLAGTGRGLKLVGFVGEDTVEGAVVL